MVTLKRVPAEATLQFCILIHKVLKSCSELYMGHTISHTIDFGISLGRKLGASEGIYKKKGHFGFFVLFSTNRTAVILV